MVKIESPQENSSSKPKKILTFLGWFLVTAIFAVVFLSLALIYQDQVRLNGAVLEVRQAVAKNASDINVIMAQSEETNAKAQEFLGEIEKAKKEKQDIASQITEAKKTYQSISQKYDELQVAFKGLQGDLKGLLDELKKKTAAEEARAQTAKDAAAKAEAASLASATGPSQQ